MKKIYDNFNKVRAKTKQYWTNFMDSTHKKLSYGSESIWRLMSSAHKDNWRRHESKKPKKD